MNASTSIFSQTHLQNLAKAIELDKRRKALRLLAEVEDVNQLGHDGMTLLMWAYRHRRPNLFKLIALKGANPTLPTAAGERVADLVTQDEDHSYRDALSEASTTEDRSISCGGHPLSPSLENLANT